MNSTVFHDMLGVLQEAVELASDAVKAAEERGATPVEPVVIEKVATSTCDRAAYELVKTGSFGNFSQRQLSSFLAEAPKKDLIEILEKLASRAIFPAVFDSVDSAGYLVEKPDNGASSYKPGSGDKTALWRDCLADSGITGGANGQ